jgi:chaperonin GroEL
MLPSNRNTHIPPTQTPALVFQPKVYKKFQKGIDLLVNAIQPTLGPIPRLVAVESNSRADVPEFLDDGGTIARRVISIKDRDAEMGLLYLRQVLWHVHEKIGDGTATTAVMFKTIFDLGVYYVTHGVNAMRLRTYLEKGAKVILDELDKVRSEVQGKEALARLAKSVCYDAPMADYLGEIIDIVGEYGLVEVRESNNRDYSREYVEGIYWDEGVASRDMVTDPAKHYVELENASIFISNLSMTDPQALIPLLDDAILKNTGNLLLIASEYSAIVLGLIFAANKNPEKLKVVAVKAPGNNIIEQAAVLEDMAILTGGKAWVEAAGDKLVDARAESFGKARKIRAGFDFFSIIGGKGDPRKLREHINKLKGSVDVEEDYLAHKRLQERVGKFMGGAATLYVPGINEWEIKAKKELAERSANTIKAALREGVVPGGGVALLNCQAVLRNNLNKAVDENEIAAYKMLIKAVEAPIKALVYNAGADVSDALAEVRRAGPGFGYDVMTGKVVNMAAVGILDVTTAVKTAVQSSVSGAALALTTDVLIHRRNLPESFEP